MDYDFEERITNDAGAKVRFHRKARTALKALAHELGLSFDKYDIRSNKGGPGVIGEITLHADKIYVQVSTNILYRSCNGRRDFTGGPNNFVSLSLLHDARSLAAKCKRLMK